MDCKSFCIFRIHNIVIRSPFTGLYVMGWFFGRVFIQNSTLDSKLSVFGKTPTKPHEINIELILSNSKAKGLNLAGNVTLKASNSVFEVNNLFMNVEPVTSSDHLYNEFHNVTFRNGTFMSDASLIALSSNSFLFDGCTFDEFRVSLREVNRLLVRNSRFRSNKLLLTSHKSQYLAFIQVYKAETVVITDTTFGNSCFGTLSLSYCKDVHISKSTFTNNNKQVEEAQGGGALLSFFSNIFIEDGFFYGNDAVRGGGTVHHVGGTLDMKNTIIYTSTTQYNSALFCQSHGSLDNVTIHVLNFVDNNRTIVTLLPFNVDFKHMGTWQINTQVALYCAPNQQINLFYEKTPFSNSSNRFTDITAGCTPCPKGTYSFKRGYLEFASTPNKLVVINRINNITALKTAATTKNILRNNNIICSRCAPEAFCDSGVIRSKGNNWGYRVGDEVLFRQCPPFYCCSAYGTPCTSYDTCAQNRDGPLCGRCKPGHSEDILSTKCLSDVDCMNRSKAFWVVYILASIALTYVLMYFKDAILLIKGLFVSKQYRPLTMEEPLLVQENEDGHKRKGGDQSDNSDSEVDEIPHDKNQEFSNVLSPSVCSNLEDTDSLPLADSNHKHRHHQYHRVYSLSSPGNDDSNLSALSIINDTKTNINNKNNSTISGIFKILVQFYQVESMLRVESPLKNTLSSTNTNVFMDFILSVFNIKIISDSSKPNSMSVCPIEGMTVITKEFILSSVPLTCLGVVLVSYIVNKSLINIRQHQSPSHTSIINNKPFVARLKSCVLQLFLIGYAAVSLYLLKLINCIDIGRHRNVLYIQGDVECYQNWQYGVTAVILLWVVPFPVSLYFSSQMLVSGETSPNEFIATLFVPFYTLLKKTKTWLRRKRVTSHYSSVMDSTLQDRESLIAILSGTFRKTYKMGHPLIVWESIMVSRRLLFCLVYVLVNDNIVMLYLMLVLLILCLVHHGFIRAFTKKWLNIAETGSLGLLCVLCCVNFFWAYSNSVNGASDSWNIYRGIGKSFLLVETVALLVPVGVCVLFALYSLSKKIFISNRF